MGILPVKKEDLVGASEEMRWSLLYDIIEFNIESNEKAAEKIAECTAARILGCAKRFDKIERKSFIEKAAIAVVAAGAAIYGYFK